MKTLVDFLLDDPEEVVVEKTFSAIKVMSARIGPIVTTERMTRINEVCKQVLSREHDCQNVHEEDEEEGNDGCLNYLVSLASVMVNISYQLSKSFSHNYGHLQLVFVMFVIVQLLLVALQKFFVKLEFLVSILLGQFFQL
jgi:hypothetical protein